MINEIITGWENYIHKSEVVEEVAIERANICSACPHAKKGLLLTMIKDELKNVEGYYCDLCKCPLSAKIRSTGSCEINKW